jgi:hypothetical protein
VFCADTLAGSVIKKAAIARSFLRVRPFVELDLWSAREESGDGERVRTEEVYIYRFVMSSISFAVSEGQVDLWLAWALPSLLRRDV